MGKNKIVVQFNAENQSDLDRLFQIEETLFQAFSQCYDGVVDGHDIGQGKFNIFITPSSTWGPVLERVKAYLKLRGALSDAVIAKFHGKTERYEVIHPASHSGSFAL